MNLKDRRKELSKVLGLSSEQEIALYDYAELLQKQPQKVTNLQREEERQRILSIEDDSKRQQLIAENIHLFK